MLVKREGSGSWGSPTMTFLWYILDVLCIKRAIKIFQRHICLVSFSFKGLYERRELEERGCCRFCLSLNESHPWCGMVEGSMTDFYS